MTRWNAIRASIKALARGVSLALAAPAAFACWLEARASSSAEGWFGFCAQCFALLPGLPGQYLRRAFFQMTLEQCSGRCYIGFGSFFTHRHAVVEDDVYVGHYTLIGCAVLRAGCLIGSQASLLSGPALHEWDSEAGWSSFDPDRLQRIEIGARSWIGERAVIMADVGPGAMIAAGSVVSSAVPPGVLVAGNPARFVRRIADAGSVEARGGVPSRV